MVSFSLHASNLRGKSLGGRRRFTPPNASEEGSIDAVAKSVFRGASKDKEKSSTCGSSLEEMGISLDDLPEKLRSLEEKYIVNILNEIVYSGKQVAWDDIGECDERS